MRCFILSALALAASALQAPSRVGAPATSSAPSPVSRYASETFRSTSVKMNIFGNKQREEEAEAARLDAEQEALNQRWAKETMQETARTGVRSFTGGARSRRADAIDRRPRNPLAATDDHLRRRHVPARHLPHLPRLRRRRLRGLGRHGHLLGARKDAARRSAGA